MVTFRAHDGDGKDPVRRRPGKVASLALGLAMFGTVGLSGTLAQDDDLAAGGDAESIVNAIIAQVFAEIFGGDTPDDGTVSGGGDLNVGGSSGSDVTMGGGGSVNMGGGSSGVTVGDSGG
jgi:hypothetical protein